MTAEEAIKVLRDIRLGIFIDTYFDEAVSVSKENEALEIAIEALEQQPCEDCISRQEAISAIQDEYYADAIGIDIVDIIANLSSVTPKAESEDKPKGRWIEKEDYNLDTYYECSECGADYCIEGDILIHKYCPNCGAKMDEVETEEEDER